MRSGGDMVRGGGKEAQEVVRKAESTLRQAEGKAESTLRQAEGKAESTLRQAEGKAESTLRQAEGKAEATLRQAERVAFEEELTHQLDMFERFFALSFDMFWVASVNGYFRRVSPSFDALGYGREELLSRQFLEFVHPEDQAATLAEVGKLAQGAKTLRYENRYRCKDGSYRWLSWTSSPDSSGALYSVARDVTDQKLAAESILQTNQFLEAVIENIPHMVFVKDAERLAFVRVNRAGEALIGAPRHALLGKTDSDFHPKDTADFFRAKDRETLENLTRVDIPEESIPTPRGPRLLHTTKVPILDSTGTPRYLLGISEDITERRAGEMARARLAAIAEDSEDAIIGRTLDGTVTNWNTSARRMFGYTADEILGQPVAVLFSARGLDEEAHVTERLLKGERVSNFETVMRRKDGRELDVSVKRSLVYDSSGRPIGVSKIARDITHVRTQRELLAAKEAADAANRELESFSYSVAHDLRSPLRSIDGFSQALLEDYADKLDADGGRYLSFIRESAQHMARLIDDMLALSRVTRSDFHRESVDLSGLARAAVSRLQRGDPERKVDVVIQEGVTGEGDPRLLAVAFDNLLGNAWKFTAKRDGARVEFGCTSQDSTPAYFVRDNGAGFDMAFSNKLFGVFQRLHSVAEFEGTGVGLATVKRIVNRHSGRIWAEGRVDQGATFFFTLYEKDRVA